MGALNANGEAGLPSPTRQYGRDRGQSAARFEYSCFSEYGLGEGCWFVASLPCNDTLILFILRKKKILVVQGLKGCVDMDAVEAVVDATHRYKEIFYEGGES